METMKHFRFEHSGKANPGAVVGGKFYRFTVLTERLFRLEYSPSGQFEDRPSQTFWFRNLEVPEFEIIEKGELEIRTPYLHLCYDKEKPFSKDSLKIKRTNDLSGQFLWAYGKLPALNLKGTYRTLDGVDGELKLEDGLMSRDGFAVVDDSRLMFLGMRAGLRKEFPAISISTSSVTGTITKPACRIFIKSAAAFPSFRDTRSATGGANSGTIPKKR